MIPRLAASSKPKQTKAVRARLALNNISQIKAERCRRSFYYFLQEFWSEISNDEFKPNWHIELFCTELMEIAERVALRQPKKYDLIFNVPPGTTKTITFSIMFPVWCWIQWFWMRFITGSYSSALSLESAEYSRDLVRSDKFGKMFPSLAIKQDKDTKSNFRIQKTFSDGTVKLGGNRYSTSVGGTLTGFHGHIRIIDDPLDPNRAASAVELKKANRWMEQTLSTRSIDKAVSPMILVMQRLDQDDPAGHILAKKKDNIKHVCLPGETRNYQEEVQPPELAKYYKDGLLDPGRMPWTAMKDMEIDLGQYGYAGQIGQRPTPPSGGMFQADHFQIVEKLPADVNIIQTVRYWDKAGTSGGGAYTVGTKMSNLQNGKFIVSDVKRGQWSTDKRERIIRETAEADGQSVVIYHEQEPGPIWEEELVQMANGTRRKLCEISEGNSIISGKGNIAIVENVHRQGLLDCLEIETDSGRVICTAKSHPFFTPDGWIVADKLGIGDILALKTNVKVTPSYNVTDEEQRLLGYFTGDGCCTYTKGSNFACNSSIVSKDMIEGRDIIHCGESMGFKVLRGGSKGWTYYLSNGVRDWLREKGLAGKTTFTKEIPDFVFRSSKVGIANFLGAYFSCDGSANATTQHPVIDYYSTNLQLLKDTQSLLLRFGIYTMLRKRNYKEAFQKNRAFCYRLTMRRNDGSMGRFSRNIPVYGVKKEKIKEFKQINFKQPYLPDPIVKIKNIGRLPCRCLTVLKDESFLVHDIVVHNSGGKESALATTRNLVGFSSHRDLPTGNKVFRADPYSVQVNSGNVLLLTAPWNHDFIEEHRFFPYSTHKDQVDASAGAFTRLARKRLAGPILRSNRR